nr:glycosyltransferase family 2 protein [Oculatella sp. FACHB-28]
MGEIACSLGNHVDCKEDINVETQPLVSIIINNYNYDRFIAEAIDSALNQTYDSVEVVVVDDGSTDTSRSIIDGYGDQVVKVFKANGGQASALNAGFAASTGEIVCILDADDIFLPQKVSEVVDLFRANSEIGWVFTESTPVKTKALVNVERTEFYKNIFVNNSSESPKLVDFRSELKKAKLPNFTPSTSNLCFRRTFLEKIFPLPECKGSSGLAICDTYLNLLAVGLGAGYVTTRNLGIFRVHENNLYSTQSFDNKRRIYAEIRIATAYWMRIRFLEFNKLSKKLFSQGLSAYLASGSNLKDCKELIEKYFANLRFHERLEVNCVTFYYLLKSRLSKPV